MKRRIWMLLLALLLLTGVGAWLAGCTASNNADNNQQAGAGQKRHVVHVKATVKRYEGAGNGHQHIIVDHIRVLGTENLNPSEVEPEAFVAIRYGDSLGLPKPIPDLKEGADIEMQGEYIDRKHASKSRDNPGDPVLHFTHHPLGYVVYEGHKYE